MKKTRIPEIMRKRGYTQEMIANELGITKQAVNLTIASANPRLSTLESIARVLNVPVYELFVNPDDIVTADGPSFGLSCPHCGERFLATVPVIIHAASADTDGQ